MKMKIDINCDMGESLDALNDGSDLALMPFISSINIACGFHAGDSLIMQKTIENAKEFNLKIGAHPSFDDRQNFGRLAMNISEDQLKSILVYQIGALKTMVEVNGGCLNHVKPHGALYNMAAKDKNIARVIAESIFSIDRELILYGLSGSFSISEANRLGLKTSSEVFADRGYLSNGELCPRSREGAVLKNVEMVKKQVKEICETGTITAIDKTTLIVNAETICIHSDTPNALELAKAIFSIVKK